MDSRSTYAQSHNSRSNTHYNPPAYQHSQPQRAHLVDYSANRQQSHQSSAQDSNPFRTPPHSQDREKASNLADSQFEEAKPVDTGFNPHRRLTVALQICVLIALIPIMVAGAMSMFTRGTPRNRANTFVLSMAAKSLICIQYEMLTAHVRRFKKWASLKAYAILGGLEVFFWGAAIVLLAMGIIQSCYGKGCTLSYVAIAASSVLLCLSLPIAYIVICNYRYFKRTGINPVF
ncbi:Hypothetical protein D9617_15g042300 [Elsinoe fawcettii]|nr:Hypothetical protein D9617_15g042300 [Elsinoe fawcettii]